jgi:hypothetical protein
MILNVLIDRVSNSNPQIFRELKERLTPKNIAIAIAAVVTIQILILLYFNGQIPVPAYEKYPVRKLINSYSEYCRFPRLENESNYRYDTLCKLNAVGEFNINWQKWWSHVFSCTNWMLALGLILGSVYMLVADLVREEKRGTLNFIRLSPQSASKIFIGKILGVPILVYIAIAFALPLHLSIGLKAGADIGLLASWYVVIGSIWFLLSSASVLYVLLGGIQAIVTTMAVAYPVSMLLMPIERFASTTIAKEILNYELSWFWLPVTDSAIGFYGFITTCCVVTSYGVWQALDRRYLNPNATVIGKLQSYAFNLCLQIGIAGFVIPLICTLNIDKFSKWNTISIFAAIEFLLLIVSIPLLLPNKQTIQDWSRYRRERFTQSRQFWKRDLVKDLIGNDKSPALLAIAINIGMAIVLWAPVALIAPKSADRGMRMLGCVLLAATLILIYATIAHLGLFLKVKKRNVWTIAIVTGVAILPLIIAYVLSPFKTPTGFAAIVLLFSPFAPLGIMSLSGGTIFATFAAQLAMFGFLTRQLQRNLQISGRSQTKELLAHN